MCIKVILQTMRNRLMHNSVKNNECDVTRLHPERATTLLQMRHSQGMTFPIENRHVFQSN
jgi:hypothetical protein